MCCACLFFRGEVGKDGCVHAQVRKVWVRLAEYAVNAGEFVAAKKYLAEVSRHCAAYDDASTSWHCQLLLGWMHALEGDPKEVVLRVVHLC